MYRNMIWLLLIVQKGDVNDRISSRLWVVFREERNAAVHIVSRWNGLSRVLNLYLLNLGRDWVSGFIFVLVLFFHVCVQISDKKKFKEESIYFGSNFWRIQFIMEEMILWQAGLHVYIQEAETNECCGSDHSLHFIHCIMGLHHSHSHYT